MTKAQKIMLKFAQVKQTKTLIESAKKGIKAPFFSPKIQQKGIKSVSFEGKHLAPKKGNQFNAGPNAGKGTPSPF